MNSFGPLEEGKNYKRLRGVWGQAFSGIERSCWMRKSPANLGIFSKTDSWGKGKGKVPLSIAELVTLEVVWEFGKD